MASYPPPPTSAIDWDHISFKTTEVNGHIETTYTKSTGVWSKPKFVQSPYLSIHGLAPGLNYGQQCYEGLKAFRQPNGSIAVFRAAENAVRMQRSAGFIAMPAPSVELFEECVKLAVGKNAEFVPPHGTGAALYVRPLLFGSGASLALEPPEEFMFVVFVVPTGVYHGVKPVNALVLEDFDRCAPNGTGSAKIGGNYAPVLIHSEKARGEGYGITLHLDSKSQTFIDEFSTSGFLGIYGASDSSSKPKLLVPSSKNVIKSVTSDSIVQIAKDLGWEVEQREVRFEEIEGLTEAVAVGTAAALVPIKSVTCRSKGVKWEYLKDDMPGEHAVLLLEKLRGIQAGKLEDKWGWRMDIPAPPADV